MNKIALRTKAFRCNVNLKNVYCPFVGFNVVFTSTFAVKSVAPRYYSNLNTTHCCNDSLKEVISFKDSDISNWIVEKKMKELCFDYEHSESDKKQMFLKLLATDYSVDHEKVKSLAEKICSNQTSDKNWIYARERDLKNSLVPTYHWLFTTIGRLENGVKFLVDLRTDILELISKSSESNEVASLQQLNNELKNLLLLWFSVGFLHVERVTWQSSCDMLEKISNYEMIHPIRNWTDLKRRVGPYRRCYVFTHPSMPREPLVLLHTALCDIIPETVKGIREAEIRMTGEEKIPSSFLQENKTKIKAAIFYSIAATQKGLQGIELGNYLIKEAVHLVKSEFPMIDQYSSLSPIPNFRLWLLEKTKLDPRKIFTESEETEVKQVLQSDDLFLGLKKLFSDCLWMNDEQITKTLKDPLLRSCAWYLCKEKRRNYALNPVANFHLRNGAVMWRINWMSDMSPRGAANSCGIMVNYRYYLENTEENSRNYIEKKVIKTSQSVIDLVKQAERMSVVEE